MKIVFDTSTLVRLVASRAGLLRLKAACARGLVIVTSEYLLNELDRTLHNKLGATKQRAKTTTSAVAKISQVVEPKSIPKLSRDPNDDPVLAAALTGRAALLVSSDKDLLELGAVGKIAIIDHNDFIKRLTKILD